MEARGVDSRFISPHFYITVNNYLAVYQSSDRFDTEYDKAAMMKEDFSLRKACLGAFDLSRVFRIIMASPSSNATIELEFLGSDMDGLDEQQVLNRVRFTAVDASGAPDPPTAKKWKMEFEARKVHQEVSLAAIRDSRSNERNSHTIDMQNRRTAEPVSINTNSILEDLVQSEGNDNSVTPAAEAEAWHGFIPEREIGDIFTTKQLEEAIKHKNEEIAGKLILYPQEEVQDFVLVAPQTRQEKIQYLAVYSNSISEVTKFCGVYDIAEFKDVRTLYGKHAVFVRFRRSLHALKLVAPDTEAACMWSIKLRDIMGSCKQEEDDPVAGPTRLWHLDPALKNSHPHWKFKKTGITHATLGGISGEDSRRKQPTSASDAQGRKVPKTQTTQDSWCGF